MQTQAPKQSAKVWLLEVIASSQRPCLTECQQQVKRVALCGGQAPLTAEKAPQNLHLLCD